MGPDSPLAPTFWEFDQARGHDVETIIVGSGFIHPPHSSDEMPLTDLYRGGEEVANAPFDPEEIKDLLNQA